jgi:Zn-dependent protease
MNREPGGSALERLRQLELSSKAATAGTAPAGPAPAPPRKRGVWGALLAGATLLFGKLKFLLGALKILSFAKLLTTSSTMLLALVVYAQIYGWRFAAAFLTLILVHELGHGFAAQLQGFKVGAPIFVPFFGAFIALKERPKTTFQDFFIGAGGPLAGTAGGIICILVGPYLAPPWSGVIYSAGYFALWLNLFNLFPVWQLDGARMTAPLGAGAWRVGFLLLAVVTLGSVTLDGRLQPMPLILLAVVGFRAARTLAKPSSASNEAGALARLQAADQRVRAEQELQVTPQQRSIAGVVYFGLATALIYLIHALAAGLPAT